MAVAARYLKSEIHESKKNSKFINNKAGGVRPPALLKGPLIG